MSLESHVAEGERLVARIWKVAVLRGALAIVFAVVVLAWPGIGLTTLLALFGAFALVTGLLAVIGAFDLPLPRAERAWLVFEGLLGVAVAVVVFVWPDLSAKALLYAIAAWAIAGGVFGLALAFVLPFTGGRSLLLSLGAVLSIAFGGVMLARPGAGAVALLALIAAFALVSGVMQIAYGLELRRVAARLKRGWRPWAAARPVAHG